MAQDMAQGGDVSGEEIVKNVADSIKALAQAASQARPDVAKELENIYREFTEVMSEFVGGGQGGQMQPRGVQPVAERGQGMPMGPQGAM